MEVSVLQPISCGRSVSRCGEKGGGEGGGGVEEVRGIKVLGGKVGGNSDWNFLFCIVLDVCVTGLTCE